MTITNQVDNDTLQTFGYRQWIDQFVKTVINRSKLKCEEVIIDDIEFSKRIFLSVDGKEFMIRTWDFKSVKQDNNGHTCAEIVRYTLFKMMIDDENSGHGNEISEGEIRIDWNN